MMYVSVAGAVVLELLCSVFLLNGLLGREEKIPRLWALLFVAVASVYILTVPDSWINGCYLITVLYVRLGYRVSWKDSLVTTVLSLVLGGVVELVCFFPFVFLNLTLDPQEKSNTQSYIYGCKIGCFLYNTLVISVNCGAGGNRTLVQTRKS